ELLAQLKALRAHLTGTSAAPGADGISAATIAQTPPTPQPGLRTPSEPMGALRPTPARGTATSGRPPPPPADAFVEPPTPSEWRGGGGVQAVPPAFLVGTVLSRGIAPALIGISGIWTCGQ